MKKTKFTLFIYLNFLVLIILFSIINKNSDNIAKMNFRTDIEPIEKRFTTLDAIQEVYWKSGAFGKSSIGPSDIWLKGFIILDKTNFDKISSKYNWTKINISFDKGIEPNITGFNDFDWNKSKEFSEDVIENIFMGNVYVDKINNIIYFELNTF